jgi:hypothetical protein
MRPEVDRMHDRTNPRFWSLRTWAARYAPLEAAGLLMALYAGWVVSQFGEGRFAIGFAAAWGENIGYYLVAFVRERRRRRSTAVALGDLVVEFGPAEVVDSLIVRPLCMSYGVGQIGDTAAGVVFGKILADVPFYGFATIGYALRRRLRP